MGGVGNPQHEQGAQHDSELNYFNQRGKGKGKGDYSQGRKGGKGDYGKGYGKARGGGFKGEGKGGKGFTKGKGNFQGDCYWCGRFGHSQRDCRDKDQYMQYRRDMKFKESQGVNNMEDEKGKQEHIGTLEQFAQRTRQHGGYHSLCSL